MSVIDIVSQVWEMQESLTDLRKENEQLRNIVTAYRDGDKSKDEEQDDKYFYDIYKYGHDKLWDEFGERRYYSMGVRVREDDNGVKHPEPFDSWYEERYGKFPRFLSAEEFKREFHKELWDKYDREKLKALGYLEEDE